MASKFSNPNPSGSIRAWHDAQLGFARCCSIRCRSVPVSCAWPSSSGTSAGGGGGGVPRICSRIHLPRFTGEVRVGFDVTVRTLACVRTPPALAPFERDPAELVALDPVDPVMPGQPLVDEREVGVDQVEDAPVFARSRPRRTARSPAIIAAAEALVEAREPCRGRG